NRKSHQITGSTTSKPSIVGAAKARAPRLSMSEPYSTRRPPASSLRSAPAAEIAKGEIECHQGLLWRAVATMVMAAPARCRGNPVGPFLLGLKSQGIGRSDGLDAPHRVLAFLFQSLELDVAGKGQLLLRGIQYLEQMAAHAETGVVPDHPLRLFERIEEIA